MDRLQREFGRDPYALAIAAANDSGPKTLAERLAHEAVGFEGSPVLEEIVAEAINAALGQAAAVARNMDVALTMSGEVYVMSCSDMAQRIAGAIESMMTEQKETVHGG